MKENRRHMPLFVRNFYPLWQALLKYHVALSELSTVVAGACATTYVDNNQLQLDVCEFGAQMEFHSSKDLHFSSMFRRRPLNTYLVQDLCHGLLYTESMQ